jgi:redox-sensitive bicupin YhaK (pirin superfamily)
VSGPVSPADAPPVGRGEDTVTADTVELLDSREAQVGALRVRRALPRRAHRTVGAWCFADHMGPVPPTAAEHVGIGPHPHMGLQTVTWLLAGEMLHHDSLGSEQVIKPGHLNLMTAGNGVAHAEEATGSYRGEMHGVQLWVAQPEATRHGDAAFEHHVDLPKVELEGAVATVIVGDMDGEASPARRDTDHLGVEVALRAGRAVVPLRPDYEHVLIVLEDSVELGSDVVEPGRLAYLGVGHDEIGLSARSATRVLLLGGVPFPEQILMWWNFVARTTDEVDGAYEQWQSADHRFGTVTSTLPRIGAPRPTWAGSA